MHSAANTYSITSSARARRIGAISIPSALAVLRLITISNFVGCWIGSSPGFSPARILATLPPGCDRFLARPPRNGSAADAVTIGMVLFAATAAPHRQAPLGHDHIAPLIHQCCCKLREPLGTSVADLGSQSEIAPLHVAAP